MSELTNEEIELYYVVKGTGGSFKTKLFELICSADLGNQALLEKGFPEFTKVVQRYQNEPNYWQSITERI